jgi:hypothetical protein
MYGMAAELTSPAITATGAKTAAPIENAVAVAAVVSSAPASSRFHPACSAAAASARISAETGSAPV